MELFANILVVGIIALMMIKAVKHIKKNGVCEGGCQGCPNACNCGKKK
ncbi:MAG: FeoB-associated Cys-rich membrane protein [Clostridia bacterium]|nr:FeoB-associated Cys-rich membrane protein [Clostridia bacterium]